MTPDLASVALWITPLLVAGILYFVRRIQDGNDRSIAGLRDTDVAQGKEIRTLQTEVRTLRENERKRDVDDRIFRHEFRQLQGFAQRRGFVVRPTPSVPVGDDWEPTPDPDRTVIVKGEGDK